MKFLGLLTCLFIMSCGGKTDMQTDRYIVETTVQLKPGTINQVLELFKATNPELVAGESDWLRATFSETEVRTGVVVRAEWKSKESYQAFAASEKFQKTMQQFGKFFMGPPKVSISKVLFEM